MLNHTVNDFLDMSNEDILKENDGKKFDIVLMNPPYGRNFEYLYFIDKAHTLLNETGSLVSIQPAKWLTLLRDNGKKTIRNRCKNILNKINDIEISNFNEIFNTKLTDIFSIIKSTNKKFNKIKFNLYGNINEIDSIDDANYFGKYETIKSILDKVNNLSENKVSKFISNKKENNAAYIRVSNKLTYHPDVNYKNDVDTYFDNKHKNELGEDWQFVYRYIAALRHKNDNEIINKDKVDESKTYIKINLKNNFDENKNILNNYLYFICHSKLGHILCMLLFQDENGHNFRNVFPFIIFDKKLNDEEYYKLFNLNNKEIEFINKCHKQFERKSKDNYLYSYLYN